MESQVLILEVQCVVETGAGLELGPLLDGAAPTGEVAAVFMRPDGSNLNHRLRFDRRGDGWRLLVPGLARAEVPPGTRVFVGASVIG